MEHISKHSQLGKLGCIVPDIFSRNNMSFMCILCKTCTGGIEEYKLVYIKVTHVSLN